MKVTKKENPRIIIIPNYSSRKSLKSIIAICESIKKDIQRHVDDVNQVYIEWDSEEICSYCSLTWEVDESGLPQCCGKAQKEWEKEQAIKEGT